MQMEIQAVVVVAGHMPSFKTQHAFVENPTMLVKAQAGVVLFAMSSLNPQHAFVVNPMMLVEVQARAEVELKKDVVTLSDVQQILLWVLGDVVCPRTIFLKVRPVLPHHRPQGASHVILHLGSSMLPGTTAPPKRKETESCPWPSGWRGLAPVSCGGTPSCPHSDKVAVQSKPLMKQVVLCRASRW